MNPRFTLTILTRLAARRPAAAAELRKALDGRLGRLLGTAVEVAVETGDPLGRVAAELVARQASEAMLVQLVESLDDVGRQQSVPLRELALAATARLLALRQAAWTEPTAAQQGELALLHRNLATRLADVGRPGDALEHNRRAVAIHRRLARDDPGTHAPELASSLNNLGNRLSQLGRAEEALAASVEAAERFEAVERERPGVHLPLFAMTLHNLASRLRTLGRRQQGLTVMGWAVERRRDLFADDPARHRRGPSSPACWESSASSKRRSSSSTRRSQSSGVWWPAATTMCGPLSPRRFRPAAPSSTGSAVGPRP